MKPYFTVTYKHKATPVCDLGYRYGLRKEMCISKGGYTNRAQKRRGTRSARSPMRTALVGILRARLKVTALRELKEAS